MHTKSLALLRRQLLRQALHRELADAKQALPGAAAQRPAANGSAGKHAGGAGSLGWHDAPAGASAAEQGSVAEQGARPQPRRNGCASSGSPPRPGLDQRAGLRQLAGDSVEPDGGAGTSGTTGALDSRGGSAAGSRAGGAAGGSGAGANGGHARGAGPPCDQRGAHGGVGGAGRTAGAPGEGGGEAPPGTAGSQGSAPVDAAMGTVAGAWDGSSRAETNGAAGVRRRAAGGGAEAVAERGLAANGSGGAAAAMARLGDRASALGSAAGGAALRAAAARHGAAEGAVRPFSCPRQMGRAPARAQHDPQLSTRGALQLALGRLLAVALQDAPASRPAHLEERREGRRQRRSEQGPAMRRTQAARAPRRRTQGRARPGRMGVAERRVRPTLTLPYLAGRLRGRDGARLGPARGAAPAGGGGREQAERAAAVAAAGRMPGRHAAAAPHPHRRARAPPHPRRARGHAALRRRSVAGRRLRAPHRMRARPSTRSDTRSRALAGMPSGDALSARPLRGTHR